MNPNSLQFLVEWFARQCDGEWEHESGIRIETLDNPGWAIHIRIEDTELEGRAVDWVRSEEDEAHWLHWRSTGSTFDAACGPRDLERALAAFESFVTQGGS